MTLLSDILKAAGFSGGALATAEGVAGAESGGSSTAHNVNPMTGDNSYGLFQINMLGAMGPQRRAAYGLKSNDQLLDPLTNAKVAFQLSKGGTDWSPWSTFKSGAYRAGYGQDRQVVTGGQWNVGQSLAAGASVANGQVAAVTGTSGLPGLPSLGGVGDQVTKAGTYLLAFGLAGVVIVLGLNKATGGGSKVRPVPIPV